MGIISAIGAVIVGFVSSKTFIYSILSQLYQVEEPDNHLNGKILRIINYRYNFLRNTGE